MRIRKMRFGSKALLIGMVVLSSVWGRPVFSSSGSLENQITSRLIYVAEGTARACPDSFLSLNPPAKVGSHVRDVLPLRDIDAIEIPRDRVALPGAIVTHALLSGYFVERDPRAFGPAISICVHFKGNKTVPITFFPISGQLFKQIKIGDAWIETPPLPVAGATPCLSCVAELKQGGSTTRRDFEKHFSVDGGISMPFRGERFVFNGWKSDAGVLKVNAAFRPKSVTEAEYAAQEAFGTPFPNQASLKQSPDDILMRLSPVYLELPFFD